MSGPATPKYVHYLTFAIFSGSTLTASGTLAPSAASFSSLALPTPAYSGENLFRSEPIQLKVTGSGTITITVTVTANGYTHSGFVVFN